MTEIESPWPRNSTVSPIGSSSTPSKPHHHRVFPPPDYVASLEEKLKARRLEKERERQRTLESMLAEAATKGSSESSIHDSFMKFGDHTSRSSIAVIDEPIEKKNNVSEVKSMPTFSTSPGPLPAPLPTQSTVKVVNSQEKSGKDDSGEFGEVISAVWGKVKGMIGFTPDCLNGGTKRLGGKCFCPEYFLGEHCEKRQCLNNGTLVRISTIPMEEQCKCPHPIYITGKHCETIHCQNGGRPLSNSLGCKCLDSWYTGQFCEYYAASWFAVLGIPLICIAVIALCCVICRLDFCPKRTTAVHRDHRRRYRGPGDIRRHRHHFGHEEPPTLMIHENLLNDCHQHFHRPPTSHSSGQIVRLETIPTYNPQIPCMPADEYKPLEPPPSYEQAVASCPTITTPLPVQRSQAQPPPIYSPPRDDSISQSPPSDGSPPP